MSKFLEDFLVKIWELSLKPQAFLITMIIFIPIKMGGSEPRITFAEIYHGMIEDYFADTDYTEE